VNRSLDETAMVEVQFPGGKLTSIDSAEIITGSHPQQRNTYEQPYLITNQPYQLAIIKEGIAQLTLPPLSIIATTFNCVI
jgi:alpha-L-arabinofuranosidase